MVATGLSGFTIGITAARADDLVGELTERGADCLHGPTTTGATSSDAAPSDTASSGTGTAGSARRCSLPADTGPARRLVRAIADRKLDVVTFLDPDSVANLLGIATELHVADEVLDTLATDVTAACLDEPTAGPLAEQGIEPLVPSAPDVASLVALLEGHLATRWRELGFGGHAVTLRGRLVVVDGAEPVRLTDRERDVLRVLAERPGVVVSKRALLRRVWGHGETDEHAVEVTVARLRQRLGAAGTGIETVIRRGYRLDVPA